MNIARSGCAEPAAWRQWPSAPPGGTVRRHSTSLGGSAAVTRPRRAAVILLTVTATALGALLAPAAGALAASPTAGPSPARSRRRRPQAADTVAVGWPPGGAAVRARPPAGQVQGRHDELGPDRQRAGGRRHRHPPSGSLGYATVATSDVSASLKALKADPSVAYAGYDYIRHATRLPERPALPCSSSTSSSATSTLRGIWSAWTITHGLDQPADRCGGHRGRRDRART